MRVVSMVLIDMSYLLISAISIGVAFLTQYWIGFGYVNAVLLLFLLYLAIVRIPLVLNYSRIFLSSIFDNLIRYLLQRITCIKWEI